MPPRFSYEDTSAFLYIHPVMTLRRPPCQAVCPAGIPVSLMNRLIAQGKPADALAVLLDITPFPEEMCRDCSRPCEAACNRRRHTSVPVPVARLEQFAASCLPDVEPSCAPASGCRAAVLDGTAAGLTVAYFLRRLGHAVVVADGAESCGRSDGRVRQFLSGLGVTFTRDVPDDRKLDESFDAVVFRSGQAELHTAKAFVLDIPATSLPAVVGEARLTACAVDAALHGRDMAELAWIRILPDGEVERERLPVRMPENMKPVTTVRYEDLTNTAYFREHLTFRDRLSATLSLQGQAMECFHCGKCTGCGTCVAVCPGDVLDMKDGKPYVRYPDECIHCSACMLDCPSSAIFFRLPLPATLGADMKFLA